MKESFGFVGVGQCGGNIVSLFQNDFNTYYINTSLEDLLTLDTDDYYHIKNANGSNHNRNKAIQSVKEYYRDIVENVYDHFKGQEIIYLVFSAGGGTGSGLSPLLLDILSSCKNKIFGAVCVLPDLNEPINVQRNAYDCMIQLSNIKNIGSIFVLDNSKNNKETINMEFYKAFNKIINMPKFIDKRGNIDVAEVKELLSIRGVFVMSSSEDDNPINILKSMGSNCFCYQQDKKSVYMALSLKYEIDLNLFKNNFGTPFDMFINYNPNENILCISGMSFPIDRINLIKDLIENQQKEIVSAIENSKSSFMTNELNCNFKLANEENVLNFNQIFDKYQ